MKIEIKNRWTGNIIFECDAESMRLAVEMAVKQRVSLRAANLSAADLSAADLRAANLSAADLRAADLRAADLSEADLSAADLSAADLRAANLSEADLSEADLSAADLSAADLRAADISAANLTPIRDDFWAVLSGAPKEVEGLRKAIVEGRISGSTYEGKCACLVGTIANVRKCFYGELGTIKPNANRPAEQFFLGIKQGDTPEKSQHAKCALEWLDQWVENVRGAFVVNPA